MEASCSNPLRSPDFSGPSSLVNLFHSALLKQPYPSIFALFTSQHSTHLLLLLFQYATFILYNITFMPIGLARLVHCCRQGPCVAFHDGSHGSAWKRGSPRRILSCPSRLMPFTIAREGLPRAERWGGGTPSKTITPNLSCETVLKKNANLTKCTCLNWII